MNISTHSFGSGRGSELKNFGCKLLQDQIFIPCAFYIHCQTRCICAVRCQQLVTWSRDVIRLFSSRRRREGKASMMTLCTFQQQRRQLHVATSRYLLTHSYILELHRYTKILNFITHIAFRNYATLVNVIRNMTCNKRVALYNSRTYNCCNIARPGIVPDGRRCNDLHTTHTHTRAKLWKCANIH